MNEPRTAVRGIWESFVRSAVLSRLDMNEPRTAVPGIWESFGEYYEIMTLLFTYKIQEAPLWAIGYSAPHRNTSFWKQNEFLASTSFSVQLICRKSRRSDL